MPSSASCSDIYNNLSPAAQFAALVYGVFYPHYVDKAFVLRRLKAEVLADRLLEGADAPARLNTEELLTLLRQPLG